MIQSVETHATLAEAQRAMGSDAIFMAGGTLVMRDVNAGATATRIVRSTDPALADIRLSGDGVAIGAGVTMATIAAHRDLTFLAPVARGGRRAADPQHGNRRRQSVCAASLRRLRGGAAGARRPCGVCRPERCATAALPMSCATAAGRVSSHPFMCRDRKRPLTSVS